MPDTKYPIHTMANVTSYVTPHASPSTQPPGLCYVRRTNPETKSGAPETAPYRAHILGSDKSRIIYFIDQLLHLGDIFS